MLVRRFRWYIAFFVIDVVFLAWVDRQSSVINRWRLMKYSWKEEWLYGATSSMPTLEITLKQDQIRYKCPFVFGGIEQAQVWYRDVDGDGVPDIVFGHGNEKIIVVFLPQAHAAPKFRLIRSDVLFNGEAGNVQEGKRF